MPHPGKPVSQEELNALIQQLNMNPNDQEEVRKAYSILEQMEMDGRQWGQEILQKLAKEDVLNKLKEIQDHRKSLLYPQPIFQDPFERWLMERKSTHGQQPQPQQNNGIHVPKPPKWNGAA